MGGGGGGKTGGLWSKEEQKSHINYLEMKAISLGLKSFCHNIRKQHIRIQSDNTTTVAYINAIGGIRSQACNEMALHIWEWCSDKNINLAKCLPYSRY